MLKKLTEVFDSQSTPAWPCFQSLVRVGGGGQARAGEQVGGRRAIRGEVGGRERALLGGEQVLQRL